MTYIATIAVEGEQAVAQEFDTIAEAWWHLYHKRVNAERDYIDLTGLCSECGEPYSDDCDDDSEEAHDIGEMARQGITGAVGGWMPGDDGRNVGYTVFEGVA